MTTTDPQTRNSDLFPGALLKQAREQAGMTIEGVAHELRLSSSQVQALEDDYYEDMPGTTYVRGYLRSYARLLNIDEEKILQPLPAVAVNQASETDSGTFTPIAPRQARSSDRVMRIGTVVILIATIAGLVTWWQNRNGGFDYAVSLSTRDADTVDQSREMDRQGVEPETSQQPDIVSTAVPTTPAPVRPSEPTDTSDAGSADSMTDTLAAAPAPAPVPAAAPARKTEPAQEISAGGAPDDRAPQRVASAETAVPEQRISKPAPGPEATPKPEPKPETKIAKAKTKREPKPKPAETVAESRHKKIVLAFDGTSWVDVRDVDDKRLLYQSMTEGRSVTVEGKPPFRVFLGNAKAVRMYYSGKPVDVAAHQQGLYARFVLGQADQ